MDMLFDESGSARLIERIQSVSADSERQWGKLDAPGMLAHCRLAVETGLGQHVFKQKLIGKLLAWTVKGKMLDSLEPFSQNSPTDPAMIAASPGDVENEKAALIEAVKAFSAKGPSGMPDGPHPFFGKMSPDQWNRLMSKHLDHHLRQFSA